MKPSSRRFLPLEHLSQALEGSGDDLTTILTLLQQDLTAAVPSYTGLVMTLATAGDPVTITAIDGRAVARASILLPLHLVCDLPEPGHIVFYAAHRGAFTALAADTRTTYCLDGEVEVDRHLPPPDPDSTAATEGRSVVEQAVGVLIDRGHPPEQARHQIATAAAAAQVPPLQIALRILDALHRPPAETRSRTRPKPPHSAARGDEKGRR